MLLVGEDEALARGREGRLDGGAIGHVERDGARLAAGGRDRARQRLQALHAPGARHYRRAVPGERAREMLAQAARSAGDEGDLAAQVERGIGIHGLRARGRKRDAGF